MRTLSAFRRRHYDRADHRGQSLVEFALVIPIMLLLTMVALDFGRVYLGYINLQNMVRIAANYAADNPDAWIGAGDATKKASYKQKIVDDAKATNCALIVDGSGNPPAPTYSDVGGNGITTDIGDTATVGVTCQFNVITPIISRIFSGGTINVSAEAAFPVKTGLVATGTGGSGSPPTAAFAGTPLSGPSPLTVQFTDQSAKWHNELVVDFNGDGVADSTAQDPQHTFSAVGLHTVTLTASNANGSSTLTKADYVSVSTAPAVVDFTATPTSGTAPLSVTFTDTSTGGPTAWAWDFNNDGTTDSTVQNPPAHVYSAAELHGHVDDHDRQRHLQQDRRQHDHGHGAELHRAGLLQHRAQRTPRPPGTRAASRRPSTSSKAACPGPSSPRTRPWASPSPARAVSR